MLHTSPADVSAPFDSSPKRSCFAFENRLRQTLRSSFFHFKFDLEHAFPFQSLYDSPCLSTKCDW